MVDPFSQELNLDMSMLQQPPLMQEDPMMGGMGGMLDSNPFMDPILIKLFQIREELIQELLDAGV